MSYRDPQTGEVFDSIQTAQAIFCATYGYDCHQCVLREYIGNGPCFTWCNDHPTEAARQMGYEVIDDTPTTLNDSPTVSGDTPTKEDNMDKQGKPLSEWTLGEAEKFCHREGSFCTRGEEECPFFRTVCHERVADWDLQKGVRPRSVEPEVPEAEPANKTRLAEALGVEEDEVWTYPGFLGQYRVHGGIRQYKAGEGNWYNCSNEADIVEIITHPERIIRGPRLTEPEIAIMRAVGAKWVSYKPHDSCFVMLTKGKPEWDDKYQDYLLQGDEIDDPIGRIRGTLFPSVHPGDCISVEEAAP